MLCNRDVLINEATYIYLPVCIVHLFSFTLCVGNDDMPACLNIGVGFIGCMFYIAKWR